MKKVTSFLVATLVAVVFCGLSYAGKNVTPPTKPAKKTSVSKDVSKQVSPSSDKQTFKPVHPVNPGIKKQVVKPIHSVSPSVNKHDKESINTSGNFINNRTNQENRDCPECPKNIMKSEKSVNNAKSKNVHSNNFNNTRPQINEQNMSRELFESVYDLFLPCEVEQQGSVGSLRNAFKNDMQKLANTSIGAEKQAASLDRAVKKGLDSNIKNTADEYRKVSKDAYDEMKSQNNDMEKAGQTIVDALKTGGGGASIACDIASSLMANSAVGSSETGEKLKDKTDNLVKNFPNAKMITNPKKEGKKQNTKAQIEKQKIERDKMKKNQKDSTKKKG